MAQSYTIQTNSVNFATYYASVNDALEALRSAFSGNTAPPNPVVGQFWYDTSTTPDTLKICTDASGPTWAEVGGTINGNLSVGGTFTAADTINANSSQTITQGIWEALALSNISSASGGATLANGLPFRVAAAGSALLYCRLPAHARPGSVLTLVRVKWLGNSGGTAANMQFVLYRRDESGTSSSFTTVASDFTGVTGTGSVVVHEWNLSDHTRLSRNSYYLLLQITNTGGSSHTDIYSVEWVFNPLYLAD